MSDRAPWFASAGEALRLVALALVSGRWEDGPANAIPQETWDALFDDGLLTQGTGGVPSADPEPYLTGAGENALMAAIRAATANSHPESA